MFLKEYEVLSKAWYELKKVLGEENSFRVILRLTTACYNSRNFSRRFPRLESSLSSPSVAPSGATFPSK
jgi:hypothetical protein